MRSFSIRSLGCKVNQYEGQQIRQFLLDLGLKEAASGQADLVIINSCSITATASAKGRQYLNRARRLNPAAVLVMCGCLPPAGERPHPDDRTIIVTQPDRLAARLMELIENAKKPGIIRPQSLDPTYRLPPPRLFSGHCRAFLKVQDGCDGSCTYCLVPSLRPTIWSKPMDQVLEEAKALVEAGHKELVLTGINLGAYGQQTVRHNRWQQGHNPHLVELICRLAQVPGLARLRLSSLDPTDIDPQLLAAMAAHPNIMPHLHLPLQSGCDQVLKRMGRQYDAARFLDAVAMARAYLDRPAITTDMIVGFPGETEEGFQQSIELAQRIVFAKIHVFAFSPRPGTPAARMSDPVPPRITRQRCQVLHKVQSDLARRFCDQFLGQQAQVLIEGTQPHLHGHSQRYFNVYIEDGQESSIGPNQIVDVTLIDHHGDGLLARLDHKDHHQ